MAFYKELILTALLCCNPQTLCLLVLNKESTFLGCAKIFCNHFSITHHLGLCEPQRQQSDKISELQDFYLKKKKHLYFHLKQKMEPFSISTVPCHKNEL